MKPWRKPHALNWLWESAIDRYSNAYPLCFFNAKTNNKVFDVYPLDIQKTCCLHNSVTRGPRFQHHSLPVFPSVYIRDPKGVLVDCYQVANPPSISAIKNASKQHWVYCLDPHGSMRIFMTHRSVSWQRGQLCAVHEASALVAATRSKNQPKWARNT